MTPEEMVGRLLYRDALMLVIDKPAGMAVHRGPKGGVSLEDHFDALRFGLPRPPALAHRLGRRPPRARGARPPAQGAGRTRPAVKERRDRQDLWGGGRGRPAGGGRPDRSS